MMLRLMIPGLMLIVLPGLAQDDQAIDTDLECSSCHEGTDWQAEVGSRFDHISTGFALEGVHADLNCSLCHVGSTPQEKHNFGRVSSECNTCHEDIHGDLWGSDCERCHNPDSWALSTQQQNHDLTNFPLRGAHQNLDCASCHVSGPSQSATLPLDCVGCHSDDYQTSVNPSHVTLDLGTDCESCHANQATRWTNSIFNHTNTQFPLIGMHGTVSCASCHTEAAQGKSTACESCHRGDYENSLNPAHAVSGYPLECGDCHNSFTWNSNFTHDQTGFVLRGAHMETLCSECHTEQSFSGTPQNCAGCHRGDWESREPFSHADAEFGLSCEECHDEIGWTPSIWSHDVDTDYPLTGGHIEVLCLECHQTSPYSEQAADCYACHQATYEATSNPNHISASIPTTCEVCHSTENWDNAVIDHSLTRFPLLGAHAQLECMSCHAAGYDLPIVCAGCHQATFDATTNPDHQAAGIPVEFCESCHNQDVWSPSIFTHESQIVDCATCHQVQYDATQNPPHLEAEFNVLCQDCHTTNIWVPTTWIHGEKTDFSVEGAHLELNCQTCHTGTPYGSLSVDCGSCHAAAFNNTEDPDHEANAYPIVLCASCHSQSAWEPSIFNHETLTLECVSCHQLQYEATSNPSHTELSFPTDCATCHRVDAWTPTTFTHDVETTGFLVDGAHSVLSCSSCHENWDPPAEVRTCASASCHSENYAATTNPPHASMEFSDDCSQCHSTAAWTPSQFSHDQASTGFLLVGAHTSVACQSCHSTWVILPQPRTCAHASCHLTDYQNTVNPDHASAAFPLDCTSCHSESAWQPATFTLHDSQHFPIYTGQHRNQWNDCTQCHINANDFAVFTCLGAGCHNVGDLNEEHFEDGSYVSCNGITYSPAVTSSDCFSCHPTGDSDDCDDDLFNNRFRSLPFPKEAGPHELH